MVNAVISGSAGQALLIESESTSLVSFDIHEPETLISRSQSDIHLLFGDAEDLQFFEDISVEVARRELQSSYNSTCALDLTLVLLDCELSGDVRKESVQVLEELLVDQYNRVQLETIFYGCPLPHSADINGALDWCRKEGATITYDILQRIKNDQLLIRDICLGWDSLTAMAFRGSEEQKEFKSVLIREGVFREFALRKTQMNLDVFLEECGKNPTISKLPNCYRILEDWFAAISFLTKTTSQVPKHENKTANVEASRCTYFGPDTKILGKLQIDESVIIEGEIEGEILCGGDVIIGEKGMIRGKISGKSIVVRGNVIADIAAQERIEVHHPGSVTGEITAPRVVVTDGARIDARIDMGINKVRRRLVPLQEISLKKLAAQS